MYLTNTFLALEDMLILRLVLFSLFSSLLFLPLLATLHCHIPSLSSLSYPSFVISPNLLFSALILSLFFLTSHIFLTFTSILPTLLPTLHHPTFPFPFLSSVPSPESRLSSSHKMSSSFIWTRTCFYLTQPLQCFVTWALPGDFFPFIRTVTSTSLSRKPVRYDSTCIHFLHFSSTPHTLSFLSVARYHALF